MSTLPEKVDGRFPSYAWPGGYPLFYISANDRVFCPDCASQEDCTEEDQINHCQVNWEDEDLFCDGCLIRIESAYGDDSLC